MRQIYLNALAQLDKAIKQQGEYMSQLDTDAFSITKRIETIQALCSTKRKLKERLNLNHSNVIHVDFLTKKRVA
jgi:hypothetical protein